MPSPLRSRCRTWFRRVLLLCTGSLLAAAAMELVLRFTPDRGQYLPYHRNTIREAGPFNPEHFNGLAGLARFSINQYGCRGPEVNGERHRLLVIGGSTSACVALDDPEAWPQIVMDRVNQQRGAGFLWVTNSGVDGLNSRHHIMHAKYLLPQLPQIDHVLVHCGLNDLCLWLYHRDFDPRFLDNQTHWNDTVGRAFYVGGPTPSSAPWYKHLRLWYVASLLKNWYLTVFGSGEGPQRRIVQDRGLQWIEHERQRRREAPKVRIEPPKLDTFGVALEAYADNLRRIAALVRAAGAEPIFMTQSIRIDSEKGELWMGQIEDGSRYVDADQLREFMTAFNSKMVEVATAARVPLLDLDTILRDKTGLWYDDIHFNEPGCAEVGAAVAAFLLDKIYPRPN